MDRRTRCLLGGLRVAERLAGMVPRRVADALLVVPGLAWFAAAPASRAAVRANLRVVRGREPRPGQVAAVFVAGARNYWDTLALSHLTSAAVDSLIESSGWEHLDHALAQGRGVVMVGAHIGSTAMAAQLIAGRGYPVTAVLEPIQPPELYELFTRLRSALGVRYVPVGGLAARQLLATLKRNEIVGLISDRDVLGTGPTVAFCGAATTFPDGAAVLSLRTGAPILFGIAWRLPSGRFRGVVEPLREVPRVGDTHADARAITQAVADHLGYYVRRHAEQWTVFQRRWPDTGVSLRPSDPVTA
ncbi:MAG: lysophospholipid acyltransferase family protein [Chloroflexi bacterium]|nr:lysophospholipid acyltransferase family protein [Chloroflexota bacterium]